MPNFRKAEAELRTRLDKWLYFIKYLEDFETIPAIFKDEVFTQAFEKAELAKFVQADLDRYESSLKVFRDNKAVFEYAQNTAFTEGIEEGIKEGIIEGTLKVARTMKNKGLAIADIIELTGLTAEVIQKL